MDISLKKIMLLLYMVLPAIIVIAQTKIEHAENTRGKLIRNPNTLKFIRGFKVLPDTKASSLAKTSDKILDEVCGMAQLNSPVGFDVDANVATYDLELKEKEPVLKVFCYLRYLIKDGRTGEIKKSMDGADIYFDINAFDIFSQMGNYWKDCNDLKFPLFFEEVPLSDSTKDYIAFKYKGRPIRIVLANNKPLFVPLTRKEFLQFLIERDKHRISENLELIKDEQKQIADTKKNIFDPVYQSIKTTLQQTVGTMDEQIEKINAEIESLRQKIAHFDEVLNTMNVADAVAPARMDYDKKSEELFGLEQLVPVGRREGVMLTKLNPDYYNYSSNAPAAQLIMVHYAWPVTGYANDPDYLQQTIMDVFDHLDYHALKLSMQ